MASSPHCAQDFICHTNKAEVLTRAGYHGPFDLSTMATSALFSTPQRTNDIVLIVQVQFWVVMCVIFVM
jgi:hypothetical protein